VRPIVRRVGVVFRGHHALGPRWMRRTWEGREVEREKRWVMKNKEPKQISAAAFEPRLFALISLSLARVKQISEVRRLA